MPEYVRLRGCVPLTPSDKDPSISNAGPGKAMVGLVPATTSLSISDTNISKLSPPDVLGSMGVTSLFQSGAVESMMDTTYISCTALPGTMSLPALCCVMLTVTSTAETKCRACSHKVPNTDLNGWTCSETSISETLSLP